MAMLWGGGVLPAEGTEVVRGPGRASEEAACGEPHVGRGLGCEGLETGSRWGRGASWQTPPPPIMK